MIDVEVSPTVRWFLKVCGIDVGVSPTVRLFFMVFGNCCGSVSNRSLVLNGFGRLLWECLQPFVGFKKVLGD